ncbi:LysR family transcriptional regulator [Rugamonas apoptosis]|uniref:LysR family transcriptional regulator n=1 Tax=Rugamonas apoptosis TaxID=2758570 RepID=A0A7W2F6U5_9BURK|nr:LysR family transcriptional regulator [Rugamonas apoptosis]MBA5686166.1 LysR family transcriptional regulator [Rugamonas apoptosis]
MSNANIERLWSHLHWLTVLAAQGSYTGAARRLNVSKAAVSLRIAELERAAGVALVQRTTRSIRLTETGQRLVAETRDHYELIAQSFAGVRDSAEAVQGLIKVTAPVAFARQQLVPRLSGFLRCYPQVSVQLDVSDRLVSLATEGFDLAIRHTAIAPDTHVAWTLCESATLLVASPEYLRERGTPASPLELGNHDCLYYPREHGKPSWTFAAADLTPTAPEQIVVLISAPFCANNSEALRDAALDHLGIALLPDFTAASSLRSGKLVQVLPDWRPLGAFASQLLAIRPYAPHVPRAVSAFIAYLQAEFSNGFL